MAIPVEMILPGHCYRAADKALRKVLLKQGRRVTYIVRGELAWTVLRTYVDVVDFAAECESEIDCGSPEDIAADTLADIAAIELS